MEINIKYLCMTNKGLWNIYQLSLRTNPLRQLIVHNPEANMIVLYRTILVFLLILAGGVPK